MQIEYSRKMKSWQERNVWDQEYRFNKKECINKKLVCKQKTWNLRYNDGKLNSIKEALKHRVLEITLCILT